MFRSASSSYLSSKTGTAKHYCRLNSFSLSGACMHVRGFWYYYFIFLYHLLLYEQEPTSNHRRHTDRFVEDDKNVYFHVWRKTRPRLQKRICFSHVPCHQVVKAVVKVCHSLRATQCKVFYQVCTDGLCPGGWVSVSLALCTHEGAPTCT